MDIISLLCLFIHFLNVTINNSMISKWILLVPNRSITRLSSADLLRSASDCWPTPAPMTATDIFISTPKMSFPFRSLLHSSLYFFIPTRRFLVVSIRIPTFSFSHFSPVERIKVNLTLFIQFKSNTTLKNNIWIKNIFNFIKLAKFHSNSPFRSKEGLSDFLELKEIV